MGPMNRFTPRTRYIPALLLAATLGFIQACDDDDDPVVPQTIAVTLSPTSGSAQQGGSTNTTVTVTGGGGFVGTPAVAVRSEEQTSELQSRLHLVCRLLLEKK